MILFRNEIYKATSLVLLFFLFIGCSNSDYSDIENKEIVIYNKYTKQLLISDEQYNDKYIFGFNRCGGINSIYDEVITPGQNLIAQSYQGETTDRVIQWTYWNSRYIVDEQSLGDGDRRLNATMEGAYDDMELCTLLSESYDENKTELIFKSSVDTWFYTDLNIHGRPSFDTTLKYTYTNDGILYLERNVTRRTIVLENIYSYDENGEYTYNGVNYTFNSLIEMESTNLGYSSITSYLETWVPFNSVILPETIGGNSEVFEKNEDPSSWYQFWQPSDLNGYVIATNNEQAVSFVFGNQDKVLEENTFFAFNHIYLNQPYNQVNVLLHSIEFDWNNDQTISQKYAFIVGDINTTIKISKTILK